MPLEINLPDGSVGVFPDGMPDEEIKSVIAKNFPSPQMTGGLGELSAMTQAPKAGMHAATPEAANLRAINQYMAMPAWKRRLTDAVDIPALIAQGGSMGLLDKAAAGARSYATGSDYETELANNRQQTEAARARQGWLGTGAELTGAIGGGLGLAKKGITAMSLAPKAGAAVRTALMGGEGAAYGAAEAYGADQDILKGAGMGALFGAGGSAVGDLVTGGISKVAGRFNPKEVVPTLAKINTAKNAAYDIAEKAGVIIKPEGMKHLADNMIADISDFGFDAEAHKGANILVKRILKDQATGQPMTLKGLDGIRKLAGNVGYIPGDKPNNAVVSKIVKHIDDLIAGADPNLMAGIDTEVGVKSLKAGRELAHRGFKLDTAQKLVQRGEQQAARNITDTAVKSVKSQVANIIDPFKSWGRGFTAAEKAAAEKAAAYTYPQKVMHGLSSLNPFGGGKGTFMANAVATAPSLYFMGPAGLALQAGGAVGGYAAGKYGESLAKKSVNEFLNTIARGGVAPPVIENAIQKMAKSKQDAVRRALMLGMNNQYNQPAER